MGGRLEERAAPPVLRKLSRLQQQLIRQAWRPGYREEVPEQDSTYADRPKLRRFLEKNLVALAVGLLHNHKFEHFLVLSQTI